jgi:hypothetical protein
MSFTYLDLSAGQKVILLSRLYQALTVDIITASLREHGRLIKLNGPNNDY